MTDPFRPARAAVRDIPAQMASPVGRMGVPEWIVIPAGLTLEYFIAAEIAPYRMFLNGAMFSLLDSWDKDLFFRHITVFAWVFRFVHLAIMSALQTLLIFGAWALSRARRLSSVLVIGALLLIKTSVLASDGLPAFSVQFALVLVFTAIAVGIAYAWARAVLRNPRADYFTMSAQPPDAADRPPALPAGTPAALRLGGR